MRTDIQTTAQTTAQLGDLIVVIFDEAAFYSKDPREVSRLATRTIQRMVGRPRSGARTQMSRSTSARSLIVASMLSSLPITTRQ